MDLEEVWHSRPPLDQIGQSVPIHDLAEPDSDSDSDTEQLREYPWTRPRPVRVRDLNIVNCLGAGGFGKVLLVRVRDDPEQSSALFALKTLPKEPMRDANAGIRDEISAEKRCLSALPWNPFINGVVDTFSDATNLYMMLEVMPYGNFGTFLRDAPGPLDPLTACFYYCNILCGLEFVHGHEIVLRDLKPDNILIGHDGYLCLTDFGLAEYEDRGGVWQLMGTAWYMAPELIQNLGQPGPAIDWWASGVILYEMLSKEVPFPGSKDESIYASIISLKYKWPDVPLGKSVKHMISRLLAYRPEKRLGYNGGALEVTEHPWLSHVDWMKMKSKTYEAPWIPNETEITGKWHHQPMPMRKDMGELQSDTPPVHLRWDRRFRKKTVEEQMEP